MALEFTLADGIVIHARTLYDASARRRPPPPIACH